MTVREAVILRVGVQVDGKLRGSVVLLDDASEDDARCAALAVPNVAAYLSGRSLVRFTHKPGRIITLVTAGRDPPR